MYYILVKRVPFIKYNYLLMLMTRKTIKNKYKKSFLGVFWNILFPTLEMLTMGLVFGFLSGGNEVDGRILTMSGIVVFGFYRQATTDASNSIIGSRGIVDKVYVPTMLFPLSTVLSGLVNFIFSVAAFCIVVAIMGLMAGRYDLLSPHLFLVVLIVPAFLFFCMGVSLVLSALNVYFRDIGHIYAVLLQLVAFVSGVYFDPENLAGGISPPFLRIIKFNPLYHFIRYFRILVLQHQLPPMSFLLYCYAFGLISIVGGLVIFHFFKKNFILYI